MHNIINEIVKQRGIDILYSKILINCMDDEGAFDDIEMRPYKKILKTIVAEDYTHKLVEIGAWNAEAETLARTFAQRNKLQEDEIIYVFSCLAYGLGWLKITPQIPAEVKKKRQQEAQKKAKEVETAQKRNEEVSRKNAEEAARKKAEIAEKRALEAERQAAEAERKAKEAEKIAKERADKQAANLVISMIKNIGVIESTKECRDKVSAALLAYKMLNSSQQVLVDLQVGDALQRMADETKKIAAEAQEKVANEKAADAVAKKIKAIGVVEYTDACLQKIEAAKQAYNRLTREQKLRVANADVITTAENRYENLRIAAAEEARKKKIKQIVVAVAVLLVCVSLIIYLMTKPSVNPTSPTTNPKVTEKIVEVPVEKVVEKPKVERKTQAPKAQNNDIKLDYGVWESNKSPNKINGRGKLTYTKSTPIKGWQGKVAQPGDYVEGRFENGKPVNANWYDKNGNKKDYLGGSSE